MKPVSWIGLVLLILGILAFIVPVPQRETHGFKMGDASVGITTQRSQKLPPVVGGILCAVGAIVLVTASRK